MGKKKLVLDTNILISALGWEGKPRDIFKKVLNKEYELILSHKQMIEIKRVMDYPKFNFTYEQKSRFLTILVEAAILVKTSDRLNVIYEDPDDNIILESAVDNGADYLITGDDHLLKLKQYKNVKILTASQFFEEQQEL